MLVLLTKLTLRMITFRSGIRFASPNALAFWQWLTLSELRSNKAKCASPAYIIAVHDWQVLARSQSGNGELCGFISFCWYLKFIQKPPTRMMKGLNKLKCLFTEILLKLFWALVIFHTFHRFSDNIKAFFHFGTVWYTLFLYFYPRNSPCLIYIPSQAFSYFMHISWYIFS